MVEIARSATQVKLEGICRGDEWVYAKLVFDAAMPAEDLVSSARVNGIDLPLVSRVVPEPSDDKLAAGVLMAFPFTGGTAVELAAGVPEGKSVVSGSVVSVSLIQAKWQSRLTYRFRKGLAQEMRALDSEIAALPVSFVFHRSVPCGEDVVVYGSMEGEATVVASAKLTLHNQDSELLDTRFVVRGRESHIDVRYPAMEFTTVHFTCRIPRSAAGFIAVARKEETGSLLGTKVLFDPDMEALAACGREVWCSADVDPDYERWLANHRATPMALACQAAVQLPRDVRFSVVVLVGEGQTDAFDKTMTSIAAQSYANHETVAVGSTAACAVRVRAAERQGSCIAQAVERCAGDYVFIMDAGDVLEPDAFYRFAVELQATPQPDFVYCDEDELLPDGNHGNVCFKPSLNLMQLRSFDFMGSGWCVSRELAMGFSFDEAAIDGAQRFHCALQAAERAGGIARIPDVLYHRGASKIELGAARMAAVRAHLDRMGIEAEVASTSEHVLSVAYRVQGEPLVSIVIPNKDCSHLLRDCIDSILEKTSYSRYEVVVVENNSESKETFTAYCELEQDERVRVVKFDEPFNFSRIVNFGVMQAQGDFVLLLNNDTRVIEGDWLERMLGVCQQPGVGAVGAKLLYPDNTVQHAGIVLPNPLSGWLHVQIDLPRSVPGYLAQLDSTRCVSAATAACLMVNRELFERMEGFDQAFEVAYNDVDFCLRLAAEGLAVVYEPAALLYHYESVSRGSDVDNPSHLARFLREKGLLDHRWADWYVAGDPFFNPNLANAHWELKRS